MSSESNKMWGGRFQQRPSNVMQEINQSISFDYKLYRQDIECSIAHAKMLAKQDIISIEDSSEIITGLNQIKDEISSGRFEFKKELEDIHMNIESRLSEIIGPKAGRLHTARSRNDQVATDFKLYVRQKSEEIINLLLGLTKSITFQAQKNIDIIMPGYTHLQTAQPVLFSHHMMAYFQMFKRDISRLQDLLNRSGDCPLGSCALGGTSFDIDRTYTAKALGFKEASVNSMDSVSDRDFAIEFLFCTSMIATHLSRIGEEIVIWMSKEFNFIDLPDSLTSGSSIMPQKKNPDGAELIRGKSGRIIGNLMSLLTTIKGLSLTYSKDMQEDKEPVFDSSENIILCIEIASQMISGMQANQENMLKSSIAGYSTATDLADYLVKNHNLPFREAHHITGQIVKFAENQKIQLHEINTNDIKEIYPDLPQEALDKLFPLNSINAKKSFGSSSKSNVQNQIDSSLSFIANYNIDG